MTETISNTKKRVLLRVDCGIEDPVTPAYASLELKADWLDTVLARMEQLSERQAQGEKLTAETYDEINATYFLSDEEFNFGDVDDPLPFIDIAEDFVIDEENPDYEVINLPTIVSKIHIGALHIWFTAVDSSWEYDNLASDIISKQQLETWKKE